MKASKKTEIEESLIEQLKTKGRDTKYYLDLVSDYMYYFNLKKKLIKDINKKGVRYETVNGNGKVSEKPNESITNLHKTTQVMLKILQDLQLQDPIKESNSDGYI